ncbi:LytTR family DNA-binding domain-containing protein [Bacillus sp. JCM 19041]|uniref:LytR/AlgR family response regulator transcription factor n=1 Tax=Bacillus sp. JCM 19041 TaxID=1460637 RepID=UPI0006D1AA6C
MSKLSILAIDDDPLQLEVYTDIFEDSPYSLVYTSTNGDSLPIILGEKKIDIALLDIEIASQSGFKLAEHINQCHENTKIIFISSYKSFALEAYNFYPLDYIVKPVDVFRLFQTLNQVSHTTDQHILRVGVKTSTGFSLIKKDEILFISKSFNKTTIHLLNNELVESNDKLDIHETKLIKHGFYRIHKSYLVNLNKVKKIQRDEFMNSFNLILYDSKNTIPVSKHRIKGLKEAIIKQFNF